MSEWTPHPGARIDGLPIFPLPHIAFFPNTLLPLHVFEPRYMAMLDDVWDGDRLLGIVQLRPGWEDAYYGAPDVHPVLGVGRIVHRSDAPKGRANILVRGLSRAIIVDEARTKLMYRTVTAQMLGSDTSDDFATARRIATIRHLFAQLLQGIDGVDMDGAGALFAPEADPSVVVDAIAAALPIDPDAKQDLLAELDVPRRADRLADLLVDLATEARPDVFSGLN